MLKTVCVHGSHSQLGGRHWWPQLLPSQSACTQTPDLSTHGGSETQSHSPEPTTTHTQSHSKHTRLHMHIIFMVEFPIMMIPSKHLGFWTYTHTVSCNLSVFEDKESGVFPGPWRQNDMVHSLPCLALSKVKPCMQRAHTEYCIYIRMYV